MSRLIRSLSSSIGTKVLIALTGLMMFGFLVGHLAGNLLYFVGPATYNEYSHKLITNPLLVPIELGLVVILLVHVYKTVTVTRRNRLARPVAYAQKVTAGTPSRKSLASSTMIYSGVFILIFIVLHLRAFKYGPYYPAAEAGVRDLARLMTELFQQPAYMVFYVIAMVILGAHLRHGFSSAFQSLGADHPLLTPKLLKLGALAAAVIACGFALIPLLIFFAR